MLSQLIESVANGLVLAFIASFFPLWFRTLCTFVFLGLGIWLFVWLWQIAFLPHLICAATSDAIHFEVCDYRSDGTLRQYGWKTPDGLPPPGKSPTYLVKK